MTDVRELYAANKPQNEGNGLFLKLEDGDTKRLRFLDLPVVYDSTFEDKKSGEKKVSTKYSWPVYNHDDEKVQIFDGGSTIYNALDALVQDEEWGDPVEYDVNVSRTGKGTDTKYAVVACRKNKDVPTDLDMPDVVALAESSPFKSNVHQLGQQPKPRDVVLDDIDSELDLSEIPFK